MPVSLTRALYCLTGLPRPVDPKPAIEALREAAAAPSARRPAIRALVIALPLRRPA